MILGCNKLINPNKKGNATAMLAILLSNNNPFINKAVISNCGWLRMFSGTK